MSSNPATYTVEIDTARDGDYGAAIDDVTEYVTALNWSNGMSSVYQEVAQANQMVVALDNSSGAFDVDRTGATYADKLYPTTLVRVRMTYDSVTATLWEGRIEDVTHIVGLKDADPIVTITCVDLAADLQRYEYFPPLSLNVRVDEALDVLFDDAPVDYPYDTTAALGYMELPFVLAGADNVRAFETAQSTIAYAGAIDTSKEATEKASALDYVRDCVGQECGGRFFYNGRSHKFIFQSRWHDFDEAIAATFTSDQFFSAATGYSADRANVIRLRWSPRVVGTPNSVLYSANNVPFTLRAGQQRKIVARYQDPNNEAQRVSAALVIRPSLINADIVTSDNSGVVVEANTGATATTIIIENTSASDIDVTTMQVRGTPLYEYQTETIELQDDESIGLYGRRSRSFWTRIQNQSDAENYAATLLAGFSVPKRRLSTLGYYVWDGTAAERARDITIGNVIRVDDSAYSGHVADYVVVGERHTIDSTFNHQISYVLKMASRSVGFVLGVDGFDALGEDTVLGF